MKNNKNNYRQTFNNNRKNFDQKGLENVLDNYESLNEKFKNQSALKKFYNDFKMLFSMLKDYISGDYNKIPWFIIAAIGTTLLYVLSPIDLIPDFFPVIGYMDDAAMVAICLKFIGDEVEEYKKWKFNKL